MTREKESWIQYDIDEIENLVLKLAKEGKNGSEIGLVLRDQYGIPSVRMLGSRMQKILTKHEKQEIPEDMFALLKTVVNLHNHMDKNKHDAKAKRGLEVLESRIRRLVKFYIREGKLPKDWRYTIEKTRLLVK